MLSDVTRTASTLHPHLIDQRSSMGKSKSSKYKRRHTLMAVAPRHAPVNGSAPSSKLNMSPATTISKFHALLRQRAALAAAATANATNQATPYTQASLNKVEHELHELGGLVHYQQLSRRGEHAHGHFNAASFVMKQLAEKEQHKNSLRGLLSKRHRKRMLQKLNDLPTKSSTEGSDTSNGMHSLPKLKLLDVGALDNHFLPYSALIDCEPIDLNPQHPSVIRRDFFDMDAFGHYAQNYDVVVLSLVVNFVSDQRQRGAMIHRSSAMIKNNGYLFLILPSACLLNCKFLDESTMKDLLLQCGLNTLTLMYTNKLVLIETQKRDDWNPRLPVQLLPTVVRPSPACNNFAIALDNT